MKRVLNERLRASHGFGMIELLASMTVMSVGVLAVFGLLQAGLLQIQRASTKTTAGVLADSEMERFRAVKYDTIGIADSAATGADATHQGDASFRADTAPTTNLAGALTASDLSFTVTGATGFPSPPFVVQIDSERLLVNSVSGSTWSVYDVGDRGYNYSTAASHLANAAVTLRQRVHAPACTTPGELSCTSSVPTKTVTGADNRSYRVDTYVSWQQIQTSTPPPGESQFTGRPTKLVTVVVRDASSPYRAWTRISSTFDEATGE